MIDININHERRTPILDLLPRIMQGVGRKECAVGFPKGKNLGTPYYKDGASILQVAIWNNFGFGVPRRAFMELATVFIKEDFSKLLKAQQNNIITGRITMERILEIAGIKAVSLVQKAITTGEWTPNSPRTIAKKRSSKPLIDSGSMNKYVTYVIRDKE